MYAWTLHCLSCRTYIVHFFLGLLLRHDGASTDEDLDGIVPSAAGASEPHSRRLIENMLILLLLIGFSFRENATSFLERFVHIRADEVVVLRPQRASRCRRALGHFASHSQVRFQNYRSYL